MKNLMIILFLLFSIRATAVREVKNRETLPNEVSFDLDIKTLRAVPLRIVLQRSSLSYDERLTDTLKFSATNTRVSYQIKEPMQCRLTFFWTGRVTTVKDFWISPGQYTLRISEDRQAEVVRSSPDKILTDFAVLERKVQLNYQTTSISVSKFDYEHKSIKQAETEIFAFRDSMANNLDENIYRKTMMENLDNPVGVYALIRYAENPSGNQRFKTQPEEMQKLMGLLSPEMQNLPSSKMMAERFTRGIKMRGGNLMKDITLVSAIGKPIKISDYKGKYVLVDFWASWCMPCRLEHPNLISAFKKYKALGFTILSVSRDVKSDKSAWLAAVSKDGTGIWPQVSDFDNTAQRAYDIRTLPSNYLLDPAGKIIARDLRGEDLNVQLAKIFKIK